jgi:hypothetical protein
MAPTLAVWYSAGSPPTTTTRCGRIHDVLGVDPIPFESGYPKLGRNAPVALAERPPRAAVERAGGLRCCGA